MKKQKLLLVMTLGVLAVAMFVGCGANKNTTETQNVNDATGGTKKDTTEKDTKKEDNGGVVNDVVDGVSDGVKDVTEGVSDGVKDVTNGVENATDHATDQKNTTQNQTKANGKSKAPFCEIRSGALLFLLFRKMNFRDGDIIIVDGFLCVFVRIRWGRFVCMNFWNRDIIIC